MEKKNVSKLSDHKIKKGKVITPFNSAFGETLKLNSWCLERLPEYLWIGLILKFYGRETGFQKAGGILYDISQMNCSLIQPKLSMIFSLSNDTQEKIYKVICRHIKPRVLTPLTIIYRWETYKSFNEFFFIESFSVEKRLSILEDTLRIYFPHQSNQTTDLRYLVISYPLMAGKIKFSKEVPNAVEALKNYPYTQHEDERMRMYRPCVRSMEGCDFEDPNRIFLENFWREIGMMSECQPILIDYKEDEIKPMDFIIDTMDVLEFVQAMNKEKSLIEAKFAVIIGSVSYALKIFKEVIDHNLANEIMGRHAIRTIIETYIMLKYLLKSESEKPNIWYEYQLYGVSKYKLILLKAREQSITDKPHLVIPILDAIVNEIMMEEFIDIDLRYFDQQGIREKSIFVNEKELYDLYYDYDSNYVHGLWGAIRESAMLPCDNPAHRFHNVADTKLQQKLSNVYPDCLMVMKRTINILNQLYKLPEWYRVKYEVNVNGE